MSALALVVVASALFLIATFGYGRDQGIYAVVARVIVDGKMPYRDAFDFKPPGIYLLYALARLLFGSEQHGIRAIEIAGLAATVAGLAHLSRTWWGEARIGLLGGALCCLVQAQLDFWHTAQPETFGGMLIVAALCAMGSPSTTPSRARCAAAGVLFGLAALLKPPLAGAGLVVAVWAMARERGRWRAPAWMLAGGCLPVAIVAGWLAAGGALGAAYASLFVFAPAYTRLAWEGHSFFGLYAHAISDWLVGYCSLVTAGLVLLAAARPWVGARVGLGALFAMQAVLLLGVALQGKFFPYHYAGLWPLTSLCAALGWWELWSRARRSGWLGVLSFAAALVVAGSLRTACRDVPTSFWQRSARRFALLVDGASARRFDELASAVDVNAGANREVAEELRRRIPVGGRVFIWGFEPVIYDLADRPCASVFLHNAPQRAGWAAAAARAELMRQLRSDPPLAIVVARGDAVPMVTGNDIDSEGALGDFDELATYLASDYAEDKRIEDFFLYLHR